MGFLRRPLNRLLINSAIYRIPTRPYAYSTMGSYTSWDSLTDRTFTGRHLPPVARLPATLPPLDEAAKVFERPAGGARVSAKSTMLFAHFAQWFTDGFLRTDRTNALRNTSTHEIDLCQLYGLNAATTALLRSHAGGRMQCQSINGEDYPCFYFETDGTASAQFGGVPLFMPEGLAPAQKRALFAMGVERANVHFGYVMFNTLFLREHNRVAGVLARAHPDWDDERLLQTARNVAIVLLIKIAIDEYINHISPYHFKFSFADASFPNERWHRQNWMSVEFSLVYRWHGLVPDRVQLGDESVPTEATLFNNALLTDKGLGALFESASAQPAGEIALFNTPRFLLDTERASIRLGRQTHLAGYNAYRELCRFPRVTAFDQISGDPAVQAALARLYGHMDNIEFYVGLIAEDVRPNSAVAPLLGRLVGIDAFSQAFTNPLLAPNVYNERTFSPEGMRIIEQTRCLSDLLHRNVPAAGRSYRVTMTRPRPAQPEPALAGQAACTSSRRPWLMKNSTYRVRYVSVCTVNRSTAQMACAWFRRKVPQVWLGRGSGSVPAALGASGSGGWMEATRQRNRDLADLHRLIAYLRRRRVELMADAGGAFHRRSPQATHLLGKLWAAVLRVRGAQRATA
ncbi:MAG: Animal haem peroxidase [uncultured Chloroflexi bacterium]|uniref:Animal haem peroxidase n=1 Tax=uncultured Chloroflexota bacterium TaxID=166587 RepID=A0A6J4IYS7_9CHLR|nr:MAG: Animal haem peroxidase [uncultured Chloroflexota bacterium]